MITFPTRFYVCAKSKFEKKKIGTRVNLVKRFRLRRISGLINVEIAKLF